MIDVNPDLLAFLREEEVRSRHDALMERADAAMDSYNGQPYGDEEEGRSQVVTRDVAEVVDQMEVSVLRVFVSGDKVVEFEPSTPDQEQFADDATEAIHRQFSRKGYQLLHDWFKEGNLTAMGVVKACVERKMARVEFLSVDPEADGAIEADEAGIDPETGAMLYKAVKLEEQAPELRDYLVPLEEFRVSPDARDFDEAAYIAHATPKSLSDLVEMGFDRDAVENIQGDRRIDNLSDSRGDEEWAYRDRTGVLRQVILMEEYVRFDADGDGLAERLCIHRVGDTILRIEPCDYQPFVAYCPFPMPGRLYGHSLADKVIDIQRVRTVLRRLNLDGLYTNLAPGYIVGDDAVNESTYDDLLTVRPNRIIRARNVMGIVPEAKNDVSGIALQAEEALIGEREARTGITRLNQGLDADALNKTATGTALMQAQGQQMEEYLARNFGESVARLMRLKLKLHARYSGPMQMRVDGEFREVNPQEWPEDMDVVIRVGLGSGKKEMRLANRMTLLQIQREVMMAGLPIVGPEQIYKSIAGVVRDASLGSPADFVIDPSTIQPPVDENGQPIPPEPSPEEKKLQAEMQMQAAKLEGEQQIQAAKIEAQREQAALQEQLARDKAQAELELAQAKAAAEMQLAEQKFAFEMRMAEQRMDFDERRAERDASRRDYETESKISQNREGGKLDE